MNTTKEELWEQLDETIKLYPECFEFISDYGRMLILNLFWKHLEQRDELLKAADEVIDEVRLAQMPPSQAIKIVKLLYKYDSKKETSTTLKQQMK